MNRLRSWLRARERRREVAEAREALDIFGISIEGLSEDEVEQRLEDLNRRIAAEWLAIEDAARDRDPELFAAVEKRWNQHCQIVLEEEETGEP